MAQKPEANWDPETAIETVQFSEWTATFIQGDWWGNNPSNPLGNLIKNERSTLS